jgi:hypothetical protein
MGKFGPCGYTLLKNQHYVINKNEKPKVSSITTNIKIV